MAVMMDMGHASFKTVNINMHARKGTLTLHDILVNKSEIM